MAAQEEIKPEEIYLLDDAALKEKLEGPEDVEEENKEEEAKETKPEKTDEPETEAKTEPEKEDDKEAVKKLKERLAKLEQNAEVREKTIGRQGEELGQLRKLKESLLARKAQIESKGAEEVHKQFVESPQEYHKELRENIKIDGALERVEQAEKEAQVGALRDNYIGFLKQAAPDLPENFGEVLKIFKETGDTDETLRAFATDPMGYIISRNIDPRVLVIANREAKTRIEKAALEGKLAEASKKPKSIIDKIEAAAKSKPLRNNSGGSNQSGKENSGDYTPEQISALSDADLAELIKEMK